MLHLAEALQGLTAHPLGGRIRHNLFRMLCFQFLQAAKHLVILIIRNCRIVQHIIPVSRFRKLPAQPRHFTFVIHGNSSRISSLWERQPLLMVYS